MSQLDLLRRITELEAENERLRAEIGIAGSPPPEGSWTQRLLLAEARVRALEVENERLRAEAKEFDEMHQAFLAENLEEYANFAKALGLPEYVQGNELPGYPHILAAIKDITARTRALEAEKWIAETNAEESMQMASEAWARCAELVEMSEGRMPIDQGLIERLKAHRAHVVECRKGSCEHAYAALVRAGLVAALPEPTPPQDRRRGVTCDFCGGVDDVEVVPVIFEEEDGADGLADHLPICAVCRREECWR